MGRDASGLSVSEGLELVDKMLDRAQEVLDGLLAMRDALTNQILNEMEIPEVVPPAQEDGRGHWGLEGKPWWGGRR